MKVVFILVRLPGIEPGTSPLSAVRSNRAELQSRMRSLSSARTHQLRMMRMEALAYSRIFIMYNNLLLLG